MTEKEFPALQQAADAASKTAQRRFHLALGCNLISLIAAATLSVVNYPAAWFAEARAVLLLLGLVMAVYLALWQPQRVWYGMRALAESIKTISWRFMMRAEPYNVEHSVAERRFSESLLEILAANSQISRHATFAAQPDQITVAMRQCRNLELAERKRRYLNGRIRDQLSWYQQKAQSNKRASLIWFSTLVLANALALAAAVVKIDHPSVQLWPTDILTAIAGAAMAWIQAKRFQELAASYALAAHEISIISVALPAGDDEGMFSTFVSDSAGPVPHSCAREA